MKRPPSFLASTALGLLVVAVGGGCNFGQSGIAPPTNRIFLPAGIAVDPDADFLYVVNSNSDLRFNAGTVVAVDLAKVAQSLALRSQRPACTKTRFSRTEPVDDSYCCRDLIDSNILSCNEPQFIQDDATIQIGSFGGAVQLQRYPLGDGTYARRLFTAVRAEPSITFADVTGGSGDSSKVSVRCSGPRKPGTPSPPKNAFCDDNWRVRRHDGLTAGALDLTEEPHVLAIDESHQALFVGHLTVTANAQVQGGGVSVLDICDPQSDKSVQFAGLAQHPFLPASLSQAVAALSAGNPLNPSIPVYATARYSPAISGMAFRNPEAANACDPAAADPVTRDLTLIPSESFYSSAFWPNGADVRGILFSGSRAFVLHRNDSDTLANPAAVAVLDRSPLPDGKPSNNPIALLQVCNGPTELQMHDAGRGDRIYVTCYDDGQIYVIDPAALVVTAIIDAGAGPTSLVFSRDKGIAYVASYANSHLSLIDLTPGSPTENRVLLRIGLPHGYGE